MRTDKLYRLRKAMGKALMLSSFVVASALLSSFFSSCVHQFPEQEDLEYNVVLEVNHILEWLPEYEMTLSRAEMGEYDIRYDFKVYPKGNTSDCVKSFTIYKADLSRPDFTTTLYLYPGEYDIYAWSDYAYAADGSPVYYDDDNFANITYIKPYEGDTDFRDAFRGMTSLTVEDPGMYEPQPVHGVITLSRPLARYKFIATDLAEFIDHETTRGKLAPPGDPMDASQRWAKLSDYRVKVIYPLYMPAVFNIFRNNPVDSWTGVDFSCSMTQLSDTEAMLAMDYVMVNGLQSSVQVMLEVYAPDGLLLARTNTMTIPTKRDRTTLVYNKFLTTIRNDGVGINPDFEGEFNIEIK